MSTHKVAGDTRNGSAKVESLRSIAKVGVLEEDEEKENTRINEKCTAWSEKIQSSRANADFEVVSSNDAGASQAEVEARRKKLFEQFENERHLILDQLQREEMITASSHNLDQLHSGTDSSSLSREPEMADGSVCEGSKEFPLPKIGKGMDSQLESYVTYEEVAEEPYCESMSQLAIPAIDSRAHINEFSLPSQYLPSTLRDRGISAESEVDRLSRQVQVLVHQLAGCQQNLLRAEIEVGVLHEENRELRCLIKDLLATYSRP